MAVNLELLARLVGRGERVVLVLPQGDPVVLMPVAEYERLVPRLSPTQPKKNNNPKPTPRTSQQLEQVDPQQGSLSDDDQYYPEPL